MTDGPDHSTELSPGVALLESALVFIFSRSGGPGGQNVNKLNTRCTMMVTLDDLAAAMPADAVSRLRTAAGSRLAHDPDRIVITSADSRSQVANKRACVEKLRELIVTAMHRPKQRRATRPSKAAKRRRLESKRIRGATKARRKDSGE